MNIKQRQYKDTMNKIEVLTMQMQLLRKASCRAISENKYEVMEWASHKFNNANQELYGEEMKYIGFKYAMKSMRKY